jgi:hypothetical protein
MKWSQQGSQLPGVPAGAAQLLKQATDVAHVVLNADLFLGTAMAIAVLHCLE